MDKLQHRGMLPRPTRMMRVRRAISVAAAALLVCGAAVAQTASGSISGQVLDQNHNPVVGATVYATKGPTDTGLKNAVETDNDGRFRIFNLPPGTYVLSAFKPQEGFGDPANAFYGGLGRVLTTVSVSSATLTNGVSITLGRQGGTLHVMAYNAVTHKPLLHVTYVLRRENHSTAVIQGEKDLPADFLVPPVDISVEFHADGYMPWTYHEDGRNYLQLRPGEVRDLTVNMQPEGTTQK